jgi:hypothetical protein
MANYMKVAWLVWILYLKGQRFLKHQQAVEAKMKIGLSYSRCVRDIVDGVVDIDDVLVLITRTDFDPHDDEQWSGIWIGYGGGTDNAYSRGFFSHSNPEWAGYHDEDQFRSVSIELWETGKLHQPRKFGAHPSRRPEIWLEAVLPNTELAKNPAAQMAWDKFQTIAGLTNVELDDKYR